MATRETTQFTIGSDARCTDGVCGEVSRVVVDPVARTVTHLVVEPKHQRGAGRLVPLDLLDATATGIQLRCTLKAFGDLRQAEETEFVAPPGGFAGYASHQVLAWPYYASTMGMGRGMGIGPGIDGGDTSHVATYDLLPEGKVGIRRGESVQATDGEIGHVQGLVIDPGDRRVTHVLLQEGHLWGKKEVAIPMGAVTTVDAGIRLSISKAEVANLPAVVVDHGQGPTV